MRRLEGMPPLSSRTRLVLVAAIACAGVVLVALAALYWVEPAGSLPSFVPGHDAGSGHHHLKHGLLALFLGAVAFAFAWLQSLTRSPYDSDGVGSLGRR
jgi:hypothetical protein